MGICGSSDLPTPVPLPVLPPQPPDVPSDSSLPPSSESDSAPSPSITPPPPSPHAANPRRHFSCRATTPMSVFSVTEGRLSDIDKLKHLLAILHSRVNEIRDRMPRSLRRLENPFHSAASLGQAIVEYRSLKSNVLQRKLQNHELYELIAVPQSDEEILELERELAVANERLEGLRAQNVADNGHRGGRLLEWWDAELRKMAVKVGHMKEANEELKATNEMLEGRIALLEQRIKLMRRRRTESYR